MVDGSTGILFWGFLIIYGVIMFAISPQTVTLGGFFKGRDEQGNAAKPWMIAASIFISWIFAKSVTNAANLGAQYGIVGGIGYAVYWLCIPFAGLVLYRLRRKFNAQSLPSFITTHYGIVAAFCFSAAILIRLFNEVWSNSSVVGGYYGASGSTPFIIGALAFTLITLLYSMWGGLRSSIVTDVLQALLFVVLLVFVVILVLPSHHPTEYVTSGVWTLEGGVDFLLVAALQCLSYPFHDPVLTDRGFISEEKNMVKSFFAAGILGFIAIVIFSFVGIHGYLIGMTDFSNVPATIAQGMGVLAFFAMAVVMITTAGSTLDSTFSSLSKLTAHDLPAIVGRNPKNARYLGMAMMAFFAVVGNLPMVFGTSILAATTISGTMVMGFAPIFVLHGVVKPTKAGFHLSFWLGIVLGILQAAGAIPGAFGIGEGNSAVLLGVNLYGLIACVILYLLPGLISQYRDARNGIEPSWKGRTPAEIAEYERLKEQFPDGHINEEFERELPRKSLPSGLQARPLALPEGTKPRR